MNESLYQIGQWKILQPNRANTIQLEKKIVTASLQTYSLYTIISNTLF